ncbi:penicillin-binding protein 1A [Leadbetterella byssophila]|uniref:penicillin-binding protein 1A n=1 Tax=Leadbetterella byssophila TaxID=316068 RepID=UPI0039A2AB59
MGILARFKEFSVRPYLQKGLRSVLGEEKAVQVETFLSKADQKLDKILYGHLNQQGANYPLIRKIYRIAYWAIGLTLGFFLQLSTNFLWLTGGMPSIEDLQNPKLNQSSVILSSDGKEIGKFFTENRSAVDSSDISVWMFKALIATEDKRFYEHSGIDLKRMASVAFGILTGNTDRGGGSTISQQLAKNLYNTRKKEMRGLLYYVPVIGTFIYKAKEWVTAVQLEKRFSKAEIATMYLNTVDYGNNAFGIKTAAKTYFNKEPKQLDISECAVLVGLQKATTYYNPIRNPENSKKRRNTVLNRLVQNGDLDAKEAEKLMSEDIKLDVNIEDPNDGLGNYFKVALAKQIENWAKENDVDIDIYRDGLKIHTSIDSRMQIYAESAMEQHMRMLQKEFDAQWKDKNPWTYESGDEIPNFIETVAKRTKFYQQLEAKYDGNIDSINYYMNLPMKMKLFSWSGPIEKEISHMDSLRYYKRFLQAGMMACDPYTGHIKAWVGGVDFDHFKYDHVKQGKRQPGSVFKPFVYTAAIDGPMNLGPCDRREDKMVEYKWKENGEEKVWRPKNANGTFTGAHLTLRSALAQSVNSVAVQLVDEMKPRTVIEYAQKMGVKSKLDNVTSIGLGTSDVSLYELVGAYGIFVNEGMYREPILLVKIEDSKGKLIAEFKPKEHQAIRPESAYLMQYMLRGNVEDPGGTGRRMFNYNALFQNGGQVAGKTGTTSNYSDAWYVGFTKDLVCGVWVGGDDRSIHFRGSQGEGAKAALPIFGIFMNKVYTDKELGYKAGPFPKPGVKIEKDYLGCYSTGVEEIESDSLSAAEIDSILTYKNRFKEDTLIKIEKIERPSPARRLDSLRLP